MAQPHEHAHATQVTDTSCEYGWRPNSLVAAELRCEAPKHGSGARVPGTEAEGHEQVGKLARLCRSMYGTRDAASIWGDTWSDVLKESSMKVGTACPAFFCSCDGDLRGLCHGDDFCVVARQKQLQTFAKVL